MVKTDAHMERIRQRLLDETAGIAKSEARRREREGKKIGKQVQLEKIKERERNKKDTEERLKVLKRSASFLIIFLIHKNLIFIMKSARGLWTMRKWTTTPSISRWRMPSRIGQQNAGVAAAGVVVCRDMRGTRSSGLEVMGRGKSKIHVHRRTTSTDHHGEVRVGVEVRVGAGEGKVQG